MPCRSIPDRAEYVNRLREILSALEADDQGLFESRLNQLMRLREDGLFVNLAKLTRELHQAVKDLNFDERLQQIAPAARFPMPACVWTTWSRWARTPHTRRWMSATTAAR